MTEASIPIAEYATDWFAANCNSVGIELNTDLDVTQLRNAALLHRWLEGGSGTAQVLGMKASRLLAQLFGPLHARQLQAQLSTVLLDSSRLSAPRIRPGRQLLAGSSVRHFNVQVETSPTTSDAILRLTLRDDTALVQLQLAAVEARALYETAMTVLSSPAGNLRLFLSSAVASIGAIRATYHMPARTEEALRDKLVRLQQEVATLAADATAWNLTPAIRACDNLIADIGELLLQEQIGGDALLPLAPRVDAIASSIGNAWRIEEQRPEVAAAPASDESGQQIPRRKTAWHDVSRRRWSEFLRRRGEKIGTLARLDFSGAELVPQSLRRPVDEMLQHLLSNALDHGIETPEHRLAIHKSASGQITVKFERIDNALKVTVHDNGRGLDLERIGRAAVQCGLLTESDLAQRDAADLVGLVFKPTFTTGSLADNEGTGRGLPFLRRAVTRLNGHITLATKQGRYTLFTLLLPLPAAAEASAEDVAQAAP